MRPSVRHTTDFDRIVAIPRRRLAQADADAWADVLTPELACAGADVSLRAWQAFAIAECAEAGGGFLALPVGLGKTLIMHALPRFMGAKRPLIVVPGSGLVDKTHHDFASYVGRWKAPSPLPQVITKESLQTAGAANFFSEMKPDLIMLEEGDTWANYESAAPQRLDRYIVEAQDAVSVVVLTGTPARKSLMGIWHLLRWTLRDNAPIPHPESEARMWSAAIDDYGLRDTGKQRPDPGPLGATVREARNWFQNRLEETPGVVIVDGDSAEGIPLTIRQRLAREDAKLDELYRLFLTFSEDAPDGLVFSDPLSRWRIDGQLGCGYFLRYVAPGPPEEWRIARRSASRAVRDLIDETACRGRPLDTEAQVFRRFPDDPRIANWVAIRDTYMPVTEVVWVSASAVSSAVDWLGESREPGIIWVGGTAFGQALSDATRLPFYGAEGRDASGRGLHAADPSRSLIASWHANKRGFNLQAWRRGLLTHPPQSAKYLEQIFGRGHRAGQDRGVTYDMLMTSGGTFDAFESAISEARFAKSAIGLTQKLLRADVRRTRPALNRTNRYRWAMRS